MPLAVLADLQGPKIRIGELEKSKIEIETGKEIEITIDDIIGNERLISTSYKNLIKEAEIGDLILINDGLIRLRITKKKTESVVCEIESGGLISSRKGMNLPGMKLSIPSLTEKDYSDLQFLSNKKIDYVALSFVRDSEDIFQLKKWLKENGNDVPVIAKIERKDAHENFESILKAADGIMIARGDLGVELSPAEVPVIQKEIIKRCNETGTLVITATQMLESMINSEMPTRAEAADVANAVWDGTDVVMLSGETSIGRHPIETVQMMRKIVSNAEDHFISNDNIKFLIPETLEENLFDSVLKGITQVSAQIKASAIVVFTFKGRAARGLAKYRPVAKIIALSDSFDTMNNLCLRWGVTSLFVSKIDKQRAAIAEAKDLILNTGLVNKGDLVIFLSRAPSAEKGRTDWLHFEEL
jgi:pyruvate kinase